MGFRVGEGKEVKRGSPMYLCSKVKSERNMDAFEAFCQGM